MRLVEQWRDIERGLPEGWDNARLRLTIPGKGNCDRAASLLGPLNPGRRGTSIRFFAARRGAGASPDAVGRLLRRLDAEGIGGELELVGSDESQTQPESERATLATAWDAALAALPADWSDVYAEVEVVSTDWLDRTALLLSPVNPARHADRPAFRFRVARRSGYGASPEMTHRCLERIDEAGIRASTKILRTLSETEHVATQGPVWYVEGRAV